MTTATRPERPLMTDMSPRIVDIARAITVGQAVAIGAILIALATGIFGLGGWLQSSRSDIELSNKNTEISKKDKEILEKDGKIDALNNKSGDLQRAVDALKNSLEQALSGNDALKMEVEFLNRLASYLQWHDATNKKLLEDVVCSMWKQSQQNRIRLVQQPVHISPDDLRRGLPPDVEKLLVSQGASSELLTRLRTNNFLSKEQAVGVSPFVVRKPVQVNPFNDPDEAVAAVSKSVSNLRVIKVITFADGLAFEMPQEIAASVHLRSDCAP